MRNVTTLMRPTASWACIIRMALDGAPSEMSCVEPRYRARNNTPSMRTVFPSTSRSVTASTTGCQYIILQEHIYKVFYISNYVGTLRNVDHDEKVRIGCVVHRSVGCIAAVRERGILIPVLH